MRIVAVLVVLLLATPARADSKPDETTATLLSLGGTVLPVVGVASIPRLPRRAKEPMFLASMAALLVAPSAGQFYAGEYLSTGFKIRIGGGISFGLGAAMLFGCASAKHLDDDSYQCIIGGTLLGVLGVGTMVVGAVHDINSASETARDAGAATKRTRMFSIGGSF